MPNYDKICFVAARIGQTSSPERRQLVGLCDVILPPILEEHGLEVVPAHKIPNPGTITRQIIEHLLESRLVIADLTELNPNVMYELGIRHTRGKPFVQIAREGTELPFDLSVERTIFYHQDHLGGRDLGDALTLAAKAALDEPEPVASSPVYQVTSEVQFRRAEPSSGTEVVLARLDSIERSLERGLHRRPAPSFHVLRPRRRLRIAPLPGSDLERLLLEAGDPVEVLRNTLIEVLGDGVLVRSVELQDEPGVYEVLFRPDNELELEEFAVLLAKLGLREFPSTRDGASTG